MHDLKREAGLSISAVQQVEDGGRYYEATGDKITQAFARFGVEITNGEGTGARLRAPEFYANPNSDNVWGVVARWETGQPVQWMLPEIAREKARTAEASGLAEVAAGLRRAADDAERPR